MSWRAMRYRYRCNFRRKKMQAWREARLLYKERKKLKRQRRDKVLMPTRPNRNYHHFQLARADGGDSSQSNLLLIDIEKHKAFNQLFGPTCSAERAIQILQRAVRAKQSQACA